MTKPTYPAPSGGDLVSVSIPAVSCATVRDFVVLAPTADRYSVRWCALGDPTDWPSPGTDDARTKQAGSQSFPNRHGLVTGIAGNDFYGYVFQERAITKMTYVGGDVVFAFDTFEEGRGCWNLNRLARVDDKVFFESEGGYHLLENDQIADIGYGFVNDTYPPRSYYSRSQT